MSEVWKYGMVFSSNRHLKYLSLSNVAFKQCFDSVMQLNLLSSVDIYLIRCKFVRLIYWINLYLFAEI